jgi:hypothetical protein
LSTKGFKYLNCAIQTGKKSIMPCGDLTNLTPLIEANENILLDSILVFLEE